MSTPTALRATRCGAFALSAAVLAVGGHLAGGGHLPAPAAIGTAVLACAGSGWLLARARRGPLVVLTVLVLLQTALHQLFEVWPHPAGAPVQAMPMDAMPMDAMPHVHPVAPDPGAPLWMLLGHAGSVLLTGLLLAWGERAVWVLLGLLAALRPAPRLPGAVPGVVAPRLPAPHRPVPRPHRPAAVAPLSRRGPPLLVPAS